MSQQSRFMAHLIRQGESATVNNLSGSVCPCMTFRGTGYSREWHRLNTAAANCRGTGIISGAISSTTIKAIFYPIGAGSGMGTNLIEDLKLPIGEKVDADLIMYGQVNVEDNTYFSVSSFVEREDCLLYGENYFYMRKTYDLPNLGQLSLLKRGVQRLATEDPQLTDLGLYDDVQNVVDGDSITLSTAITGWGTVMVEDGEAWAEFSFDSNGTVLLRTNSPNVINSDTNEYICIYHDGSHIKIKNRLGATKTIAAKINYYTP